jgi:HrpA-like RNA helicase
MYTEPSYLSLEQFTPPEMQRSDLSWVVLELKALGVQDVLHFDFLSAPSADSMCYALELLYSLGALDDDCNLTAAGNKMAEMPIEPRLSRCLLASLELGCADEMLTVAAMCDVEPPFITLRGRASEESKQRLADSMANFVSLDGDHLTLLNVFRGFAAANYSASWSEQMMMHHRVLVRAREVHYLQYLHTYVI